MARKKSMGMRMGMAAATMLPSEKAIAYKRRLEEIKQEDRESRGYSQLGKRLEAAEVLAVEAGESRNQIHRYIRLAELTPELLDLVDARRLPLMTAVDISYIDRSTQRLLVRYMQEHGILKSYQVAAIRMQLERGQMINYAGLERILGGAHDREEPKERAVTLAEERLRKYFPASYKAEDMERVIIQLLELWRAEQDAAAEARRRIR